MMKYLHLEDDEPLRDLIRIALEATVPQIELVQFSNSDKTLDYIKLNHEQICGYIFDIRVIGTMTGVELAQKMRNAGIKTPIMMTSAYLKPSRKVMDAYQLEWLAKPSSLFDLQKWVLQQSNSVRKNSKKPFESR